ETLKIALTYCQACRHGISAELHNQVRLTLGNQIKRIPHMQRFDRAAGTLEQAITSGRTRYYRPVMPLLDSGSQNADDTLVPVRMIHTQGITARRFYLFKRDTGQFLHLGLYRAS